jgi:hypothetical protein
MTKLRILQEDEIYSFRSYFELPHDPDEILAEFGYALNSFIQENGENTSVGLDLSFFVGSYC